MYYRFNDVDVDRYMVDGELRLALASARELDISALPPEANFVDQHPSQIHSRVRHRHEPCFRGHARWNAGVRAPDIPPRPSTDITVTAGGSFRSFTTTISS